jgi:hypothetical protein
MREGNEEEQSALLQLLMRGPQLGYIARPLTTETSPLATPLIRHYLDWNRCGRVLTTDHENALPPSMWPLVFARANTILQEDKNQLNQLGEVCDSPDSRPSTIYQLFRGFLSLHLPALSMGIGSHVDNHDAAEPEEKRQKCL